MTWWRVGSRPATAARSATVLPAPTSPVTTPSADSTTQKLIRAIASACAGRANRSRAAMDLPNGVRARPKCAAHGAALTAAPPPGRVCRGARPPAPAPRPAARRSPLRLVLAGVAGGEQGQLGEVDLGSGAGGFLVRGGHQPQGVDRGQDLGCGFRP